MSLRKPDIRVKSAESPLHYSILYISTARTHQNRLYLVIILKNLRYLKCQTCFSRMRKSWWPNSLISLSLTFGLIVSGSVSLFSSLFLFFRRSSVINIRFSSSSFERRSMSKLDISFLTFSFVRSVSLIALILAMRPGSMLPTA